MSHNGPPFDDLHDDLILELMNNGWEPIEWLFPTTTSATFDDVRAEVTPESRSSMVTARRSLQPTDDGEMVCDVERRKERIGPGKIGNLVLDLTRNTVWPGAIINTESLVEGNYAPALSPDRIGDRRPSDLRSPITVALYTDAAQWDTDAPDVSRTFEEPTSVAVEGARVDLLNHAGIGEDTDAATAAMMDSEVEQVHSESHLAIHLGVEYSNNNLDIAGQFDFDSDEQKNRFLGKFFQVYYTMGLSLQDREGNFVTDRDVVRSNDAIISNVFFGRVLLFAATSQLSADKAEDALKAAFNKGPHEASGDFDIEHSKTLREMEIHVQAVGGSADDSAKVLTRPGDGRALEAIGQYIEDGANYGPNNPGRPIGYEARYLATLEPAEAYLTTQYDAKTCRPATQEFVLHGFEINANRWDGDPNQDLEVYGDILVGTNPPDGNPDMRTVWSRDKGDTMQVKGKNGWHTIDLDEDHPTVTFDLPPDRTWEGFMDEAAVRVRAALTEHDPMRAEDWGGQEKVGEWQPTESRERLPTLRFNHDGNVATVRFNVTPQY
jgi:thiol-activated cytolysin